MRRLVYPCALRFWRDVRVVDEIAGSNFEQRGAAPLARRAEGRMPGVRSTPGKCVYVNRVSRVRIPLSPPNAKRSLVGPFFLCGIEQVVRTLDVITVVRRSGRRPRRTSPQRGGGPKGEGVSPSNLCSAQTRPAASGRLGHSAWRFKSRPLPRIHAPCRVYTWLVPGRRTMTRSPSTS